jgi:hypothetical protein
MKKTYPGVPYSPHAGRDVEDDTALGGIRRSASRTGFPPIKASATESPPAGWASQAEWVRLTA